MVKAGSATPAWIFFDCFNTLIHEGDSADQWGLGGVAHIPVEAGHYDSVADFRHEYEAWHRSVWNGNDWKEVPLTERLETILQRRTSRAQALNLARRMLEEFERTYIDALRPMNGVLTMLESWFGVARLAVVSNFFLPAWPHRVLNCFEMSDHFDFVVDSCTVGYKKPGQEIFEAAIQQARIPGSSLHTVLFVGDSWANDVQAPQRLGMRAYHFNYAERSRWPDAWSDFRPGVVTLTKTP